MSDSTPTPDWVTPPRHNFDSGMTEAEEREVVMRARAEALEQCAEEIIEDEEVRATYATRTASLLARAEAAETERDAWKTTAWGNLDLLMAAVAEREKALAKVARVEAMVSAAFTGDEYDENAISAVQEGEMAWFKWLATDAVARALAGES